MQIESGYNRERIWNEVAANLPLLPVGSLPQLFVYQTGGRLGKELVRAP
jgi:hypothetical protein